MAQISSRHTSPGTKHQHHPSAAAGEAGRTSTYSSIVAGTRVHTRPLVVSTTCGTYIHVYSYHGVQYQNHTYIFLQQQHRGKAANKAVCNIVFNTIMVRVLEYQYTRVPIGMAYGHRRERRLKKIVSLSIGIWPPTCIGWLVQLSHNSQLRRSTSHTVN